MSKWWWKPKGKVPLYPTEAWVKIQIKEQLNQLGFWYFMPAASAYGKDGIPDFVVCSDGYFIGIEAKKLAGEWRAAQQDRAREIDKANGVYVVVDETGLMHLWNLLSQWKYNRVLPQGIHDFRRMKPEIQQVDPNRLVHKVTSDLDRGVSDMNQKETRGGRHGRTTRN